MASEWREVPLHEAVALETTVVDPAEHPDMVFRHYSIPAFDAGQGPEVVRGFEIRSHKFAVRTGAILVSKLNPRFPRVWEVRLDDDLPAVASTEFLVLYPRPEIDGRYVKYLCQHPAFRAELVARASGTSGSHQRVRPQDVLSLRVMLPPLAEQRAIAHILGTLDDKIELNRRMSETLEQIARAIFKAWFVDFEPVHAKMEGRWRRGESLPGLPGHLYDFFPDRLVQSELGEIPEGWKVKGLDEIAQFLNGLALQKYPPDEGPSLPVIKIAELRKGNTQGADICSANLSTEYIVNDGDILFSWSGSLECVIWAGGKGALNQHLFKVSSVEYPKWFCYFWIHEYLPTFRDIAADKATTMGHIQRYHLSQAKATIPTLEVLRAAHELIAPIMDRILNLRIESRTLAALRDALLPKLISGELRVKDAERFLEERCL